MPSGLNHNWTYSYTPIEADVYVIYGVVEKLSFPNSASWKIFVCIEPPEIFQYDLEVLNEYDLVVSAGFSYLFELDNLVKESGLLNWAIGRSDHVRNSMTVSPLPSESVLSSLKRMNSCSVVSSMKRITSLQRKRILFYRLVQKSIPSVSIYGRDTKPIDDKMDALLPHAFHIAIENSIHDYYWTEKLSDPLLTLTKVFYVGDSRVNETFGSLAVTPINIDYPSEAIEIVLAGIHRGIDSIVLNELVEARKNILETLNLHRVIEKHLSVVIEKQSKSVKQFPPHAFNVINSFKIWFDRSKLSVRYGLGL